MTAADDKFCNIFLNFWKNKVRYFIRIVCQQTILMKYHVLYVNFENAANFEIVVCCKLQVALYGLSSIFYSMDHMWFGHGSWINMWLFKFPFWVKDFSQNKHLKGLYPEWILSCIVRCDCHRKLFPHSIQTYSEKFLWDCLGDLGFFTAPAKKQNLNSS